MLTIKQILKEWLHDIHAVNTKESTQDTVSSAIELHIYPSFGSYNAAEVTPKFLLEKINNIKPPATRKRLLSYLIKAFDYAIINEHLQHNTALCLRDYIKTSDYKRGRYAVLPKKRWAAFFKDVESIKHTEVTKLYFWSIVYSALRASEASNALKSEFNFDAGTWIVPSERMKNKQAHTVYLADNFSQMLQEYFGKTDSKYAFHSPQTLEDKPLNPWCGLYIIKKAYYAGEQTQHGLRKIFSSHAHESNQFSIDAIELSIDHRIHGVRGIYNVAEYEDERRQLMHWYASEIDKWRGVS